MSRPVPFFTRLSLISGTITMALWCIGTAAPVAAQGRGNPKWLLSGIAPSQDQWKQFDTLTNQSPGWNPTESLWKGYLLKYRAVLTPAQQVTFDSNAYVDSVWYQYNRAVNLVWGSPKPREVLLRGVFAAWYSNYSALHDSIQNVSLTRAELRQRGDTSLQAIQAFITPAEQQQLNQQIAQFTRQAALVVAVQAHDAKRLFPGVAPSKDQQGKLAQLQTEATGASENDWEKVVPEMRAILTPTQQAVFDVNVTVDSAWKKYGTAFEQLWQNRGPGGGDSVKTLFLTTWEHYRDVTDSLQNVPQTPIQMGKRWEADRRTLRSIESTLGQGELQQLRQQLNHQFEQFSTEAESLRATTRDPKRLFAGVAPSKDQQNKLAPLQAQTVGAQDAVWQKNLQDMRAVLTPAQQSVFDANIGIDAAWQKYRVAFQQLWENKTPPWDDTLKVFFAGQWNHYLAENNSLQNVAQTAAEMEQRWDVDRKSLLAFLNDSEQAELNGYLK